MNLPPNRAMKDRESPQVGQLMPVSALNQQSRNPGLQNEMERQVGREKGVEKKNRQPAGGKALPQLLNEQTHGTKLKNGGQITVC